MGLGVGRSAEEGGMVVTEASWIGKGGGVFDPRLSPMGVGARILFCFFFLFACDGEVRVWNFGQETGGRNVCCNSLL